MKLSSTLKLIADESRLTILITLSEKTSCVSNLVKKTGMSQSLISHHLQDLKNGGLVEWEKDGKWVFYRLSTKGSRVIRALKQI